jgi:hypothetical protein
MGSYCCCHLTQPLPARLPACPCSPPHLHQLTCTSSPAPAHFHLQIHDEQVTTQWIAPDGSSIDYGQVDLQQDYWHPQGLALIADDEEPDEEDYEEYTGNAGGRSVVLW